MTTDTVNFVPADLDATQWKNLEPLYQDLLDRSIENAGDLERLILDRSELDAASNEAQAILYITMTCHTDDKAAKEGYLDFVRSVEPHLKTFGFELDKKISQSAHADELPSERYEVLLRDHRADVEIFREENVPLQTKDTELGQKFSELSGAMTVSFDGEERTMPQMGRYLETTDRSMREGAWRGIWTRRYQDKEALHGILDEMIALRHKVATNAGFDNYRDFMFKAKHRFDYTPEHCEAFHLAAEKVCVPVLRALHGERKELLGVDELRPWDVAVDVRGREPLQPFDTADQLVEKCSRGFHQMDERLGKLFDRMRDGTSLDLESRKGKAPGGYQYNRDRQRQPFIFMNAAGLHRDLETMVHESGHAFHSMLSETDPLVHYRHSPLEFAEVASMSMELMFYPYLGEFYNEEDCGRAKRGHLESLSAMLPWIATVDAFQHWMYLNPEHSHDERADCWNGLVSRFGGAVSWEGLEQYRSVGWQRQLHIFEVPFYYIEYGIAQLGALQMWLKSKKSEAEAIESYSRALKLGGSRPLPELFEAADLRFDFGPETVSELMDAVKEELATIPA